MNYHSFEKALFQPMTDCNLLLALSNQKDKASESGLIYTLFRNKDNMIKIGYMNKFKVNYPIIEEKGYQLVDSRNGTEREYKLLSITLDEIGYKDNRKNSNYKYSISFINHLYLLGWPIGSLKRKIRKKYFYKK